MDWSTLRAQIRREIEEPSDVVFGDDSLLFWLNESARDITVRAKPIRDLQTIICVVGQDDYALPEGTLEVIQAYCGKNADDNRTRLARQDFTDWANFDIPNGKPSAYTVDNSYIYVRPAPDDTYDLSFFRYALPAEVVSDADDLPFDSRCNTALSYFIRSKAMEQIGDWNAADALLGRYNAEVDKIITQEGMQANAARSISVTSVY